MPPVNKYDALYNPRLAVPEFPNIAKRWDDQSRHARTELDCYLDVPYGSSADETMDIFRARGTSRAFLIFIHGGYWRALDKANHSWLAPALVDAGITVAIPNYSLCPKVKVRDIVMQMVQACAWGYRNGRNFGAPPERLYVCGHSAGGHLTAMMLACHWQVYASDLPRNLVKGGLSISGVFDLRDILKVPSINSDVHLTMDSAMESSPVGMPPASNAPLYLSVGDAETKGFLIQHQLMKSAWNNVIAAAETSKGKNHFTILEELISKGSQVDRQLQAMLSRPIPI